MCWKQRCIVSCVVCIGEGRCEMSGVMCAVHFGALRTVSVRCVDRGMRCSVQCEHSGCAEKWHVTEKWRCTGEGGLGE